MENKQSRWRSKLVWVSLMPVILIIGDTYGLWNLIGMPKQTFTQLFTSIGGFLVVTGILNSPTEKDRF